MPPFETWDTLIERIMRDYFGDPDRRLWLAPGEVLVEQDARNNRLYCILEGAFAGTIRTENELGEEEQLELFRAEKGDFLGVTSFFSRTGLASTRVICLSRGLLAWIDRDTPPVNEDLYGGLRKQFIPLILEELSHRQKRLSQTAREREVALRRLHVAEKFSTLGELSTGLAHELNNAVGVLVRSSDHLMAALGQLLQKHEPGLAHWFERGAELGQSEGSEVVRKRARELAARFHLEPETAKRLARMVGRDELAELPQDLEAGLDLWETGRDCHDMLLAARHAASIVRSVKQLARSDQARQEEVDLNTTLAEALALLQSEVRQVTVEQRLTEDLPPVLGNGSELVQVWINIIKNGCDALRENRPANPTITLTTRRHSRLSLEVILANNGPPIPPALLKRLFQPNITTKRGAHGTMGLGLGLCIVKRIVDSYNGELLVESEADETRFRVILPLRREAPTASHPSPEPSRSA